MIKKKKRNMCLHHPDKLFNRKSSILKKYNILHLFCFSFYIFVSHLNSDKSDESDDLILNKKREIYLS